MTRSHGASRRPRFHALWAVFALVACDTRGSAGATRVADVAPPALVPSSRASVVEVAEAAAIDASPAPSLSPEAAPSDEGARSADTVGASDDLFAGCTGLWRRWKPEPLGPPKRQPGSLRVVPDVACPAPSGWAGIAIWSTEHLFGFSADSRSFVNGCDLLRVDGGKAGAVCGDDFAFDGQPMRANPGVAARLRTLGAPAREGRWSRDDLYVRWSVARGGTIVYELCSDVTLKRVTIHSYPGEFAMPLAVHVSPDGAWLAIVSAVVAGEAQVKLLGSDALVALVGP